MENIKNRTLFLVYAEFYMMARITFGLVFVSLLMGGLFTATASLEAQRINSGGVIREAYGGCSTISYNNPGSITIGTVGWTPDWGDGSSLVEGNIYQSSMYDLATIDSGEACVSGDVSTPQPTANLTTSASSVQIGNAVTLSWSSANATSCSGTGFSTGGATSGSVSVSPQTQTTYALTCTNGTDNAIDSATVSVTYPPVISPIALLTATPGSIDKGRSVQISWSSSNAASCTGSGFSTGGATSGSVIVTPGETSEYVVTCRNTTSDSTTTVVPGTSVTTLTNNTWNVEGTVDVSDFYGNVTSANRAYGSVATCPSSAPTGGVCSPGGSICKINTVNGSNVETTLYSCEGGQTLVTVTGGTTVTTPSVRELVALASAVVTVVPRADLSVSGVTPSSSLEGQAVSLNATIANTGDIASSPFSTRFEIKKGTEVVRQSGDISVQNGSTGVASVTHVFQESGVYNVRACADIPGNRVAEYNENNNCTDWVALVVSPIEKPEEPVNPNNPGTPGNPGNPGNPGGNPGNPGGNPGNPGGGAPQPVAGISANPTSIEDGASSTLTWSCSGGSTTALGSGFSTGGELSGSVTVSPSDTTTYTVVCRNGATSATASTQVTVTSSSFGMTFNASPLLVRTGFQSTLTWTLTGNPTCTLEGPGLQRNNIRTSGNQVVTVNESSTYSLSCTKGRTTDTRDVTIRIIPSIGEF